jgi:mono/diheme cytochrome c family protein
MHRMTKAASNRGVWILRLAMAATLVGMTIPAWGAQSASECAAAKKIFSANCAVCHMANGTGNAALKSPNFTDPKWQAAHPDAELFAAISNGVKGTAMPSWKAQIKPAQINALIKCVVRPFGKKASPAEHSSSKKK